MKKFLLILIIFFLAISIAFASGSRDKPSNKITIYTSMYQEVIDIVEKELKKHFPRYNIEFVYGGTGRLIHRVATERAAGRLGCDILMVAEPAYSLELKENEMLHSYLSKEASHLAFEYDTEGYWYPVRINNMVLAFNPARNSRASLPASFYDFANSASVRGAISMRNPSISGSSLAALIALRDRYGYEYFNALSRQNIHIEYGTAGALSKLETGEYKVIMILEESILQSREQGSNFEVIYPTDGTIMIPSNIMIVNNRWSANRNIKAAEEIADWFLSEAGQNAIVSGWMHSVRIDFPRTPHDGKPITEIRGNSMPVDWESSFHQKNEVIKRFDEILANRR